MADGPGRPRGRDLDALELKHLRLLLDLRDRARQRSRLYEQQLEDFVLELNVGGGGPSYRGVGEQLGVDRHVVEGWIKNARKRRGG